MLIYEKTVAGEDILENMPTGAIVVLQTDVDFDIAFFNPLTDAFDPVTAVTAPGGLLGVPHHIAKITGNASVRIINSK